MRPALRSALAVALLTAVSAAPPVAAQTIFNTGVDASGTKLVSAINNNTAVLDPHYQILTGETSTNAVVINDGSRPGTWITSPNANWIWATSTGQPTNTTLTLHTTFTLGGIAPSNAILTGQWATDNFWDNILINGVSTGITNTNGFGMLTPFTISSGFVAGTNTLDFVVRDVGAIAGLLVTNTQISARQVSAVPEPATVALLAGGLLVLGAGARRRTRR